MILTSILSILHSFSVTHHLALIMVYTFCSSKDMHNAAHNMIISDIATSSWLIDFFHREKSFKELYARYQDLIEKYQRSVKVIVNDSFPRYSLFNM